MDISVVIVNYNVKYFLEQALYSVQKASSGLQTEIIVVDNASSDASVEMVLKDFPSVKLIQNKENVGFSVANNQGFAAASGKYILILNPDTVLRETTLIHCFQKMEADPSLGALGVRMIDGSGQFLPESKRGIPTPLVAFYKMSGLYKLFPKSPHFNAYYAGQVDEFEQAPVDVLAGAFMFVQRQVIEQVGGFDETFFMYGEDIDLSYRIRQLGLKIWYFPEETIIHYKGESTKKSSIRYIRHFHEAMVIFAGKHFPGRWTTLFKLLLHVGVWSQAFWTFLKNSFIRYRLFLFDMLLCCILLLVTKHFWANWYFADPDYYKPSFYYLNAPLYTGIWLACVYWFGGHDTPLRLSSFIKGILMGTLIILAVYGLLNVEYRSSRVIILIATSLNVIVGSFYRRLFFAKQLSNKQPNRTVFVGDLDEQNRALQLLNQSGIQKNILGVVHPEKSGSPYLGELADLEDILALHKIQEVIFCTKNISNQSVMQWMSRLGNRIQTRIFPEQGQSILGSFSKNEIGEVYTISVKFNLQTASGKRQKRLFDMISCLLYFPGLLIMGWKQSYRNQFMNAVKILFNRKSWIGYPNKPGLPKTKPFCFNVTAARKTNLPDEVAERLYFLYAKTYSFEKDIQIVWQLIQKEIFI